MRSDWWGGRHRVGGGRHTGGGPWMWGRFFGAGEVRLALLSLLEQEPKHGYQLMKELEERSGGLYRASAGTIYPTLQLLEEDPEVYAKDRVRFEIMRHFDYFVTESSPHMSEYVPYFRKNERAVAEELVPRGQIHAVNAA